MNDFNEKPVTEVNKEEPILTINLRYSYKDYIRAIELNYINYNKSILKIFLAFFIFLSLLITIITLGCFIEGPTHDLSTGKSFLPICIIANFFWAFVLYNRKKKRNPFLFILNLKLNHLSKFYKNRAFKEIKIMEIPCSLTFYNTYLIKTTPIINDILIIPAERILDLPLAEAGNHIDYITLCNLNENDAYISFCPEVFIPKIQIKKENKENLKIIMKKIYFSQHNHL